MYWKAATTVQMITEMRYSRLKAARLDQRRLRSELGFFVSILWNSETLASIRSASDRPPRSAQPKCSFVVLCKARVRIVERAILP